MTSRFMSSRFARLGLAGILVTTGLAVGLVSTQAGASAPKQTTISMRGASYKPSAPAGGTDDYHCTLINPHVTKSSYIVKAQFFPNSVEVHHAILFLIPPNLAALVVGEGPGGKIGRDEEEDGVVDLDAVREELRLHDVRALGHVGVDEGAVVVVGAPRGGGRPVRGALHGDGGLPGRRCPGPGGDDADRKSGGHEDTGQGESRESRVHATTLARGNPWCRVTVAGSGVPARNPGAERGPRMGRRARTGATTVAPWRPSWTRTQPSTSCATSTGCWSSSVPPSTGRSGRSRRACRAGVSVTWSATSSGPRPCCSVIRSPRSTSPTCPTCAIRSPRPTRCGSRPTAASPDPRSCPGWRRSPPAVWPNSMP